MVTQKFHMDDPTEGLYDMIIGRDLLSNLGIDLIFSTNII